VGLWIVVLGIDSEEYVLGVRTYQLKFYGGNKLLLYDALLCFLDEIRLYVQFYPDGLDILYGANLFGHTTLKKISGLLIWMIVIIIPRLLLSPILMLI